MLCAILLALQIPVTQRYAANAISASGEIYVMGGSQIQSHKQEAQVDVFNPKTNQWRRGDPMKDSRDFAAVTTTGRLLMFAGGLDRNLKPTNRVDFYDLVRQKWTEAPPMPVAVSRGSADLWGLECLFAGGIEMEGKTHVNSKVVQMFNRRLSSWSRGPDLPYGVHAHTTTVVGDTVYVVAGVKGSDFDPSADILALSDKKAGWKMVGSLPKSRMFHGTVVYKGCLYVFGNRGPLPHPSKFDPKTGKVTDLTCPDIRNHRFAYAKHGDKVYFFGGDGPDTTDRVFDLATETWVAPR
jgi:N-acetylneuraminic acid mutarotase